MRCVSSKYQNLVKERHSTTSVSVIVFVPLDHYLCHLSTPSLRRRTYRVVRLLLLLTAPLAAPLEPRNVVVEARRSVARDEADGLLDAPPELHIFQRQGR